MIDAIIAIFDWCFNQAFNFLTLDLSQYSPSVSSIMETVNGLFQTIGYALLIILTLWGIVRNCSSFTELKKPEIAFRVFIRFILTKYMVGYAWTFVNQIFSLFAGVTEAAFQASSFTGPNSWSISRPSTDTSWLESILNAATRFLNPLSQVPSLLISLIAFIIALVLAVTLLLTVIGRFFKIYLFAAISPLPLATLGAESTQDVGRSFIKSFVAVSVEGLIIGLSMVVFSAYLQMPSILGGQNFFGWLGSGAEDITYSFSLIFNMLLFLGIIKGTDHVVQRIFGI